MTHRRGKAALRAVRAIVRVEFREMRRNRTRSLLLFLLVMVPVAAVVAGTTLVRITTPTDDERRARAMGSADLRVEAPFEYEERVKLTSLLEGTARFQRMWRGVEKVGVPGRNLRSEALVLGPAPEGEPLPGLVEGAFVLRQGRVPRNPAEVALSPVLMAGLGRSVGDTVTLEYGTERTITGVVAHAESLDAPLVVRTSAAVEHGGEAFLLVALGAADLADDTGDDDRVEALATRIREAGFDVTERRGITGEGGEMAWGLFVLGTIGFLEAGLVVAATFIVGLRRRQYEIGLLGSAGATGRAILGSLLISTGALASAASLCGAVLGTAAAAALVPFLDGWNRRLNGGFEVSTGTSIATVILGVVVALAAATLPSLAAARMPIRQAMGARRPMRSRSLIWLVMGLGTVGLGLLLVLFAPRDSAIGGALAAIVGSILGVLGFGVTSPFLLDALGRRSSRLPLRWRLAMRDAGRFRARNGPVVTAVLAGMSMSVTVAILVASLNAAIDALPSMYRSDQLLVAGPDAERVAAELTSELGAVASARLDAVYRNGEPVRVETADGIPGRAAQQWIATGDERLLETLGAGPARDALRSGDLIRLRNDRGGVLQMLGVTPTGNESDVQLSTWRDGRRLDPLPVTPWIQDQNVLSPAYVLHPSRLEQLGWHAGPPIDRSLSPWLVRLDRPLTEATLERARELAGTAVGVTLDAQLLRQSPARGFYHVMQWLCILAGLVIVLIATTLSSVESAADVRVLHAVGASPGLVRAHRATSAGYLAFLGCLLALPAGMIPAFVLFEASRLPLDVVVPWFDLAVALFALPLLAYTVALWTHREERRGSWWRDRTVGGLTLGFLGLFALGASSDDASAAEVRWEDHVGRALDGSPIHGRLGRITVPIRHADPDGATMELAFVRYPTDHPNPGPPVFFLAGGPGASGVEYAGIAATHPQMRLLEHADVIGLDQRGTGLSRPRLEPPPQASVILPADRALTREDVVGALRAAARRAHRYWRTRGVDPSVYNTRESADDVDAVRRALGLTRIVTYGSSYGSHLALAHLRRHPKTVARSLLTNVEGPDDTMKLPATVQEHLEALARRCLGDARMVEILPDLPGFIERLLSQLSERPVRVGPESELLVGPFELRHFLSNALSSARSTAEIPARLLEFSRGDWSALAETARSLRQATVELMPWAMDCASGASESRLAEFRRQGSRPEFVLGDAIAWPHYPETCEPCEGCDLGATFRSGLRVDVPVLFVSGGSDVRTPPSNVDAIAPGFCRHAHVRVLNAGHESRELMSPEYRGIVQAFLRGEPVTSTTIVLPPVPLELPEDRSP